MKTLILIACATFLVVGLSGCCGSQPPAFVWQPLPTFEKRSVTPTKTITVPYQSPTVQYSAPAVMSSPCMP